MNKDLLILNEGQYLLEAETASKIAEVEKLAKEVKKKQDELKEAIKAEMESKGILSIKDEINGINISYIAPSERETFNSKKFREEHSELFDEYVNFSPVKSSIRISVK